MAASFYFWSCIKCQTGGKRRDFLQIAGMTANDSWEGLADYFLVRVSGKFAIPAMTNSLARPANH
jgi:hypothetical protein